MITFLWILAYLLVGLGVFVIVPDHWIEDDFKLAAVALVLLWPGALAVLAVGMASTFLVDLRFFLVDLWYEVRTWFHRRNRK